MDLIHFSRNSEVCRACLKRINENTRLVSIDVLESATEKFKIRHKLSKCVPELDLKVTPNAALCTNCLSAINFTLDFKKACLQNEEHIQSYARKIGSSYVNLIDLIQQNVQIKQEPAEIRVKDELLDDTCDHTMNIKEKKQEDRNYLEKIGSSCVSPLVLIQQNGQMIQEPEKVYIKDEPLNDILYDCMSDVCENEQEDKNFGVVESKNEVIAESTLNIQNLPLRADETVDYNEEDSVFSCNECGESMTSKAELSVHFKIHEKKLHAPEHIIRDTQLKCHICGYKASRSLSLVAHMRNHTGEKSYSCNQCPYKCAKSYDLKLHTRIHTGETPHKCKQCDYKTARASNLIVHMRTHTGDKPYTCTECPYKCATSTTLKQHMRVHTRETPYKCKLCEYESAKSSALVVHMRNHTGDKPYSCSRCPYKCAASSNLKQHMRFHTGETPFKCKLCAYKSATSSALTRHMRTHSGEK